MKTIETLEERLSILKTNSSYKSSYDWDNLNSFLDKNKLTLPSSDGIVLINNYIGCQHCHTGFQIDSYLEGCTHDCKYCYAKIEGEAVGKWNAPLPLPLDFTQVWAYLYKTFESKETHLFSELMSKKVPLRIGSLSDPFMPMEKKLGVTKELIKILNHYNYPYLLFTRSALIAHENYKEVLKKSNCSIHISIPSLDEKKTAALEPGASSPAKRLEAIKELRQRDLWVTARINPLFPVLPDQTLTQRKELIFKEGDRPFSFYSDELIHEVSKAGCKSILTGFVTLKSKVVDQLSKDLDYPLRELMTDTQEGKDFYFSKEEIKEYYYHIHKICRENNIDFSTCYLGQPDEQYFSNQELWSNKKDCCNSTGNVTEFKTTSTSIPKDRQLLSLEKTSFLQKITINLMAYLIKKIKQK